MGRAGHRFPLLLDQRPAHPGGDPCRRRRTLPRLEEAESGLTRTVTGRKRADHAVEPGAPKPKLSFASGRFYGDAAAGSIRRFGLVHRTRGAADGLAGLKSPSRDGQSLSEIWMLHHEIYRYRPLRCQRRPPA